MTLPWLMHLQDLDTKRHLFLSPMIHLCSIRITSYNVCYTKLLRYNRLKKNMALQMDGTLNYGKYSHIKITPERIRNDASYFNSYNFV